MFLPSFRSPSFRVLLIATVAATTIPLTAFGAPNSRAMREALVADYPLTKVGVVMFKTDYNRITQQGVILAVRLSTSERLSVWLLVTRSAMSNRGESFSLPDQIDGKAFRGWTSNRSY